MVDNPRVGNCCKLLNQKFASSKTLKSVIDDVAVAHISVTLLDSVASIITSKYCNCLTPCSLDL